MTGTTWATVVRTVERGIRYAILAVFVLGVRRRNPGAVVNTVFTLVGALLPAVVERRDDVEFRPWQRVYVHAAMITHAVGMLGPYDDVWWWDHPTYTLSASILGGFIYAAASRRGRAVGGRGRGGVFCAGALWEVVEYADYAASDRLGLDSLLVSYSARDTFLDLVFNVLGALLVLAFGDRLLGDLADRAD